MIKPVPFIRFLLLAVLLFTLVPTVHARTANQIWGCEALPAIEWREARTNSFAILYPGEFESLGQTLSTQHGETLDLEYTRFEALFETALSLPVSIRIYPSPGVFRCLNAQLADIQPWSVHSHVGSREIALIGSNILADMDSWSHNFLNILRYGLGALFVEKIAGDQVPPGLMIATGRYLQDPALTFTLLSLDWRDWLEPSQEWGELWEGIEPQQDLNRHLQAASIVAYLVDTHGWAPFLKFLKSLPASENYRLSLSQAYGMDFRDLEEGWVAYYPQYFRQRWQYHAIYNYDFTPSLELIRSEKYVEAERQLQEVIDFLEKINQPEKLQRAHQLLGMAKKGYEADALVAQSRQAFYSGDYTHSLVLLQAAEGQYSQIGNSYRMDELFAYRDQVIQVLELHEELAQLQGEVATEWNTLSLSARLSALGHNLSALGDVHGHARVRDMAVVVATRQRGQHSLLSLGVLAVILALLGYRIWLLRRWPAPEAQL